MSAFANCQVACSAPARYVQQLVKHWGHKFPTAYDAASATGTFAFSEGTDCRMTAGEGAIAITLCTPDLAGNERLRSVIERHLDRFAFREAPLAYPWVSQ